MNAGTSNVFTVSDDMDISFFAVPFIARDMDTDAALQLFINVNSMDGGIVPGWCDGLSVTFRDCRAE